MAQKSVFSALHLIFRTTCTNHSFQCGVFLHPSDSPPLPILYFYFRVSLLEHARRQKNSFLGPSNSMDFRRRHPSYEKKIGCFLYLFDYCVCCRLLLSSPPVLIFYFFHGNDVMPFGKCTCACGTFFYYPKNVLFFSFALYNVDGPVVATSFQQRQQRRRALKADTTALKIRSDFLCFPACFCAPGGGKFKKKCPTETPVLLGEYSPPPPPTLMMLQYDFYGGEIPCNASKVYKC